MDREDGRVTMRGTVPMNGNELTPCIAVPWSPRGPPIANPPDSSKPPVASRFPSALLLK